MERFDAHERVAGWTWEHALLPGLVLLFAVAAAASAAAESPQKPAPPTRAPLRGHRDENSGRRSPLVSLHLAEVLRSEGVRGGALLLEDEEKSHVLPLFLDGNEAEALRRRWAASETGTSGTERVLGRALERLGGTIDHIEVTETADDLLAGRIVLLVGEEEIAIDAEPAEAVGVAVGAQKPLLAPLPTLERHGIRREAVSGPDAPAPTHLRPPETL